MRRLVPDPGEEDLAELYTALRLPDPPPQRPYTALGMVSSVDGAAAVDGRTAALGGEADQRAFSALRETCDGVLVGAGTARTEGYGPLRPSAASRRRRADRGLDEVPRLVVVSGSLDLDPHARLFADSAQPPVVVTTEDADPQRRARLAPLAELVTAGTGRVDLSAALQRLRSMGMGWLLCEGGPRLAGELVAGGLLDELFLTLAPTLVSGGAPRIVTGHLPGPRPLELLEVREHTGELLLRYRIAAAPPGT